MVLYQYLSGEQSPAAWVRKAQYHEEMKWLGRGYAPSRSAWYNFRDRAGRFIEQIHQQLIHRALDEELLDPSVGVQDGTTIAACASRHRMINRSTLDKRMGVLDAAIKGELTEELPKWVPATESGKLDLSDRLQKASTNLDGRIEANAKKPSDKRKNPNKILVSTSDPEAPFGRDKMKVYRPLYTVQLVVAPGSHLIMSYCCQATATDAGTLAPMIDETRRIVGEQLKTILADSGYCSIIDLQACLDRGIELLAPVHANSLTSLKQKSKPCGQIPREEFQWDEENNCYHCPGGHRVEYLDRARKQRHSDQQLWENRYRCKQEHCQGCPLAAKCLRPGATCRTIRRLEGQELLEQQRRKMADPDVQARYQLRGQTVELAIADCKANRQMTRFHGRGLARARTETGLMVVAKNLLRLDRLERNRLKTEGIKT